MTRAVDSPRSQGPTMTHSGAYAEEANAASGAKTKRGALTSSGLRGKRTVGRLCPHRAHAPAQSVLDAEVLRFGTVAQRSARRYLSTGASVDKTISVSWSMIERYVSRLFKKPYSSGSRLYASA